LLPGISRSLAAQRKEVVLEMDASLGRHLMVRRQVLGHRQIDAAAAVGVDPKTWMWWEQDMRQPYVHQYPAIIRYLGYEPWAEPLTLGSSLLAQRRRQGLSIKRAAEIVGVDEGTFGRWESGEWKPQLRSLPIIDRLLDAAD
jgi:DNA-binding XRE family transcriptional regulator